MTKDFKDVINYITNAFEAAEMGDLSHGAERLFAYAYANFISAIKMFDKDRFEPSEFAEMLRYGVLTASVIDDFISRFKIDTKAVLKKYGLEN